MNDQVCSMKESRIDRPETDACPGHDARQSDKSGPNRIGDGDIELLERCLPKSDDTSPRKRRIERVPVDVGVIVPEWEKVITKHLNVGRCHDEKNKN